jgi:pyruvate kinase
MNPKKRTLLQEMLRQIKEIIQQAKKDELQNRERIQKIHPNYRRSARNLINYRSLRKKDLSELQKGLGDIGLSRLAKANGHVMASLQMNRAILESFVKEEPIDLKKAKISFKKGSRLLKSNAKALLGYRSKGRRTRIMVTLPSVAANDYQLVKELIANGMNCARINCAHDGPEEWKRMVDNVRSASANLKKNCKIAMDLGGPKIRTGSMAPGPEVTKFVPNRDPRGQVIHPAEIWLSPEPFPELESQHLPVAIKDLIGIKNGDVIYFNDTRSKKRKMTITTTHLQGCWAKCFDTAYFETGVPLYRDSGHEILLTQVGNIPPTEQTIILHIGDTIYIHRSPEPGQPALYDEEGNLLTEAHISCTAPEVFTQVAINEPVLFDDGKIKGVIRELSPEGMRIEIVYAKEGGGKLRADKGMNFPESALGIQGLTEKDREDLAFVVQHADVINMSFVNTAQDVSDLISEVRRLVSKNKKEVYPGVILKIETQAGYNNLIEILLEGMKVYPIGVMIARGDLAVEVGWENIGRVQEEILSLCQASHVTDIWATQVLENLAKKGIPSRAEITDAAMAQRADCVMLNKGPYIHKAIQLLDAILKDMDPYRDKNAPLHPSLTKAKPKKSKNLKGKSRKS